MHRMEQMYWTLRRKEAFEYIDVDHLGNYSENNEGIQIHIDKVLELPDVIPGIVKEKDIK